MLAVETTDLSKDYRLGFWRKRSKRALDHLNLQVEAGETFGLLGPNGAGKSTTLKILFRFIFPTSGQATLLGHDLSDLSVRSKIGYLPENPCFYDHLTAEEFLRFAADLFGLSKAESRNRTGRLLDRVGLTDHRKLPLRKFSKGMVQRLGIAQALVNNPDLIFLDEPMSGLDPIGRREVRNLILELRQEGKTVFFSTHILSDAETLCDRVAILDHGRLQGCGELRKILGIEVAATEMVLEDPPAEVLRAMKPLARTMVRTGDRVRIEFPAEVETGTVLNIALRSGARVISVNPLKVSLEDYFMARIQKAPEAESTGSAIPAKMDSK
ncbi:MAG TPA: ABC transporter ATP-binding protein [Terriglobia bacterium]|nr:ABC transporter ATP-binding protein [Terriglobia bacterium]